MKIYIDGEFYDKENAKVSVFDHGLLYGDGIFEGIRFYNGRVRRLEAHIDRLWDSAKALCLTIPMTKAEMTEALLETLRVNGLEDGYVRLVVTRGVGNLGLDPNRCERASVIIIASTISLYPEELYQKGLMIITCATRRMSFAAMPPAIKSLNYLNNILAKIEANQAGAAEALMLNEAGYIAECTADNVFVVKKGRIFTPPVSAGSLRGITRGLVFEIAEELEIPITEVELTRYDVFTADEVFLTGTAAEVVPVRECDTRIIGDGKPGPVTHRVTKRFRELVRTTGVPFKKAEPALVGAH
ncbi:MAG: branched-chain-amino-acid transaminase [Verrucomicrobia bacterium]|nr:branched-chain-amino-acid transaminase [Verrucomicrobiota bacterium]